MIMITTFLVHVKINSLETEILVPDESGNSAIKKLKEVLKTSEKFKAFSEDDIENGEYRAEPLEELST